MNYNVELLINKKSILAEGPCWDDQTQTFIWIDIVGEKLFVYRPEDNNLRTYDTGQAVGAAVPNKKGGLVLALKDGFYSLNLHNGDIARIHTGIEHDKKNNRFNDGKCDSYGRFWAGTMDTTGKKAAGSLYYLTPELEVQNVLNNVSISNGLAWSKDNKTMYYIDTPTKEVLAFDFDLELGKISNKRVVISIPDGQGVPDGMTIDKEGMLWIAQWGGWCVSRWNPVNGELLDRVSLPVSRVTSCTFAGKNLDELYITTASEGLTKEELSKQANAGCIFKVKTDTTGFKVNRFNSI